MNFSLLLFTSFFFFHLIFFFRVVNDVLPTITPYIASLALCSFIILISSNMKGKNKIILQSSFIAILTSGALFFLLQHSNDKLIYELWKIYSKLSYEIKFALGIVTIGGAYFGGALYVGNIVIHQVPISTQSSSNTSSILQTPATESISEAIEIPENLPIDDKVFFESMLER